MKENLTSLGERLAFFLRHQGMSQTKAAEITQIPQATINHIIRKKKKTYKDSVLLAHGLGVNHDWLVHGKGGVLNPNVNYLPVINDYLRLRIYHEEGFFSEKTQFITTEQNYGKGQFSTVLDGKLFICSERKEKEVPNVFGYLIWSEQEKLITSKVSKKGKIFTIHEVREYAILPSFITL